eukprot:TRINITY_DN6033_c0_g1_i2.p1 TRINITY_DN6033_c0_g1~~TRINITY_DN6033_c0_g1_i2.p1  ORF type:complete len:187 (-),score=21.39 TRINITY_DN6033_c0_g1_i2:527-1087(-)
MVLTCDYRWIVSRLKKINFCATAGTSSSLEFQREPDFVNYFVVSLGLSAFMIGQLRTLIEHKSRIKNSSTDLKALEVDFIKDVESFEEDFIESNINANAHLDFEPTTRDWLTDCLAQVVSEFVYLLVSGIIVGLKDPIRQSLYHKYKNSTSGEPTLVNLEQFLLDITSPLSEIIAPSEVTRHYMRA